MKPTLKTYAAPRLQGDQVHLWLLPASQIEAMQGRDQVLRKLLSQYNGLAPSEQPLRRSPRGKPDLAGGRPYFSVSGSDGWMLAAFCMEQPVGVDLERLKPGKLSEALWRKYFSPAEAARLEALPAPQREREFLQVWTRKEALLKLTGLGLQGLASLGSRVEPQAWVEELNLSPGVVASLAMLRAPESLQCMHWFHQDGGWE
jgi:4'-phosphopantetheinyl transferase